MNPNTYITACKSLSLKEKQAELRSAKQNATAAATLHDFELTEYYLGAIGYLSLFDIADEILDVPERGYISHGWQKSEQN